MQDKIELLKKLEKEIKEIPERDRNKFFGKFFVSIISSLLKRLVKYEGYSVTNTILEREIKEIGKRDAQEILKILHLKEKTPDNVSKTLKTAALLLGFNLEVRDGETYVKECPFAVIAKQTNEPVVTSICSWYCSGVAEEIVGENYTWQGFHDISKEIPECFFKTIKRR